MEKVNWKLDEQNTADYLDLCRRTVEDDEVFNNFRRMEPMNMIVENSPEKSGREYFECINNIHSWLKTHFEKFTTSDNIGNPETIVIDDLPYNNGRISPTTLRYIKTLGDLQRYFGLLDNTIIAEIGGGYGGLCKIIHDVYSPKEYLLFDLPDVLQLQKKFLTNFGIKTIPFDSPKPVNNIELLIAMYSWSELSHDLQNEYLTNVISKAKNCYIMLNYDMEYSYQLLKDAFPNAEITDHNLFYDDNNTEYAPYNRFVIIKN